MLPEHDVITDFPEELAQLGPHPGFPALSDIQNARSDTPTVFSHSADLICHKYTATPDILELLRRAGHPTPRTCRTFTTTEEHHALVSQAVARGERVTAQFNILNPPTGPGRFVPDQALMGALGDKGRLGEWVPEPFLPNDGERPRRLVVVGASLAGLRAVEAARREGYDGPITLVGAEAHLPYDRPPLSKAFLTNEAEATFFTTAEKLSPWIPRPGGYRPLVVRSPTVGSSSRLERSSECSQRPGRSTGFGLSTTRSGCGRHCGPRGRLSLSARDSSRRRSRPPHVRSEPRSPLSKPRRCRSSGRWASRSGKPSRGPTAETAHG
ncbi:FAD-dependent oxidoreductase [Streptomyces sp. ISL-100]|nr:FAD-dependent oxidoreductase [Streptomyces sp. ISL-100]